MKVLIVYAHNEPSSLTSSLKNVSLEVLQATGHESLVSDLYAQGFHANAEKYDFTTLTGQHFNYANEQKNASLHGWSFSPDITSEMQKVQDAELVIFHFPVWWFSAPAILKGWFDRVLAMGVAWDTNNTYQNGYFRGKNALVVATAGSPESDFQPLGLHKATLKQMLHPILHGTLASCGFQVIEPYLAHNAHDMSPDDLHNTIEGYREYLSRSLEQPTFFVQYQ